MRRAKNTRMCLCCRKRLDKSDLIRISNVDGVYKINFNGNTDGKSVYVCPQCVDKVIKKKLLSQAFKCDCGQNIYNLLKEYNEQTKGN